MYWPHFHCLCGWMLESVVSVRIEGKCQGKLSNFWAFLQGKYAVGILFLLALGSVWDHCYLLACLASYSFFIGLHFLHKFIFVLFSLKSFLTYIPRLHLFGEQWLLWVTAHISKAPAIIPCWWSVLWFCSKVIGSFFYTSCLVVITLFSVRINGVSLYSWPRSKTMQGVITWLLTVAARQACPSRPRQVQTKLEEPWGLWYYFNRKPVTLQLTSYSTGSPLGK